MPLAACPASALRPDRWREFNISRPESSEETKQVPHPHANFAPTPSSTPNPDSDPEPNPGPDPAPTLPWTVSLA